MATTYIEMKRSGVEMNLVTTDMRSEAFAPETEWRATTDSRTKARLRSKLDDMTNSTTSLMRVIL